MPIFRRKNNKRTVGKEKWCILRVNVKKKLWLRHYRNSVTSVRCFFDSLYLNSMFTFYTTILYGSEAAPGCMNHLKIKIMNMKSKWLRICTFRFEVVDQKLRDIIKWDDQQRVRSHPWCVWPCVMSIIN